MSLEIKKQSDNQTLKDKMALKDKSIHCFYYQVMPSIKAPVFKSFIYKFHLKLETGQRVKIPFGPRQITGFILHKVDKASSLDVPLTKIKSILELDENQAPIKPENLDWFKWLSDYYHYPLGSILNLSFLSPSFKKKKLTKKKSKNKDIKNSNLENPNSENPNSENLNPANSNLANPNSENLHPENSNLANPNSENLNPANSNLANPNSENLNPANSNLANPNSENLHPENSNLANPNSENLHPENSNLANPNSENLHPENSNLVNFNSDNFLKLTPEQEQCVRDIPINKSFQVHLLHGVTGSGKTEVYIQLIAQVLKKREQALVLLPEIFLTPQIVKRLSHVFPEQIALWHSQVTKAQKKQEAQSLLTGDKNLLVGTRSALFCPLPKLALIIIDEEHDSSFKQEDSLRYQARDSALVLAQKKKIPIVLGSATPDFSSYQKALDSSYQLHELKTRALKQQLPQVTVVDLKEEKKKSPYFWMSDFLLERMEQTLKEGNQIALFLNRRGQAKSLSCTTCGFTLKCPNCDISLTLHQKHYLICHYCSYLEQTPHRCKECHSDHWLEKGLGTQKVEEDIQKIFPQYKTLRADRDSISSQKDLLNFIKKVENQEVQILIGTQMLAKGLNFPSLRLVGLLLADMDFNFPDFRAEERGFQTLLQMAGRAGRAGLGEVILQSFYPDHPNFQFLKSHDYKSFFLKSIQSRKTWSYPPFAKLCLLKIDSLKEKEGQVFAEKLTTKTKKLKEELLEKEMEKQAHASPKAQKSISQSIQVLGPSAAPLMKIKNRYRFQILIKTKSHLLMSQLLKKLMETAPKKSFIQLKIDRDPYSML